MLYLTDFLPGAILRKKMLFLIGSVSTVLQLVEALVLEHFKPGFHYECDDRWKIQRTELRGVSFVRQP